MRILVVENEPRVGQFIAQALHEQSYTSRLVATCAAARDAVAEEPFDAIVLDLGLNDGDGLDLLAEWRQHGFTEPVLIVSARDALADRVNGLNRGADDYLPKPFSVEELIARIRSLVRRHNVAARVTVLSHGDLRVDLLARTVVRGNQTIDLTSREFALLELFLHHPRRVLSRTLIAEKVWESCYDLETNLIDVYIRRLRRKLESPNGPPLIKTIRGTGYQLV